MQLSHALSSLLVSVLCATALVDARPTPGTAGMITIPLQKLHKEARSDVHPLIRMEQHKNRAIKRFARMTGHEAPSQDELRENILRRARDIEARGEDAVLGKRMFVTEWEKAKTEAFRAAKGAAGAAPAGADMAGPGFPQPDLVAAEGDTVAQPIAPTATQSLGLADEANDVGYIGVVQLGTPPQDFRILMDSGSADFWVAAENCASQAGGDCGGHTALGPQGSQTFVDTGVPFAVQYGQGNVAGDVITDTVSIANLVLANHTFGVATSESVDFAAAGVPFDGLMGLAQSILSQQKTLTPVESLAKAGLIGAPVMSYKLSRLSDNKNDGEVTFGGLDAAKFVMGTVVNIDNVNQDGFWEAPFTVSVDGTDLGLQGRTAILDTGTSLMIAPPADAAAFHAAIPGAAPDGMGGFTIPCTTSVQVAFTFGGTQFAVNPLDLLFVPVDPNNLQGQCASALLSNQIGGPDQWLLGDSFLKNVYFTTNVMDNQVSLSQLA